MSRECILAAALLLSPCLASAQGLKRDDFFLKPLPAGGVGAVSGLETVCTGAGLATTAASVTSNVVTLTMASNPVTAGFASGRTIQVLNFTGTDTYFNGTFVLTNVSSTQLQYSLTHANNSASTNGGVVQNPTAASGCSPLATIYSDQALTVPIVQGFPDDGRGNTTFYAAPGNYWVAYSASGLNPMPMNFITLPCTGASGCTFTGPTTTPKLNNIIMVDGVTYPVSTAGLQAAIAAAIAAGGGIVDARGMGSFNITSEIDVGNHAQVPVTLLLPQAATWTVSGITNGTSCAIKQFSQSSILGPGTGGSSAMVIHAGAVTNNLDSLYCTEPSPNGNGSYIRAEGFQLYNPNTATMVNGAMNVTALFDDSEFKNIVVASYGTVGLNVHGIVCCGAHFTNLTSNGNNVANSIPVQILGASSIVAFYNLSAGHPGTGKNAIFISGVGNGQAVRFYNTYSEGNSTDTTTANVSAGSTAGPIEFYSLTCNDNGSSTAYCVDIPNSGTPNVNAFGMQQIVGGSANCLNDHYSGKTYACQSGNMPLFANRGVQPGASTVAQLPAASVNNAGQMRVVTDSTAIAAEGQTCAGSSTNTALAFSSGAAWKCF